MPTQDQTIDRLAKKGWRFGDWISAHNPEQPEDRVAVLIKKPTQSRTCYCEVNPDGTTNGGDAL